MRTDGVERFEVATRDVVRAHESIRDTFAGHRLVIRGSTERFTYRQTTARAGDLAVDTLHHTMGVQEDVDPVGETWVALLAGGRLRVAHAREDAHATPGDVVLFPQGRRFTCEWQVMRLQVLRVPTREIARRAAARSGTDPADFRFESMRPLSPGLGRYCGDTLRYVHSLFRGDTPAISEPLVLAGAVDTAAAAVLAAFPSTGTTAGHTGDGGGAHPAAVRRSTDFIDAHAGEPLTLADIAEASGIGSRALQEAFRRHLDETPTGYLRRVRLERAHRELLAADPGSGVTVASVAARWGFAHPGRFAGLYQQSYGRSPQQTLRG
ncbi:AraC family transcriptional regulator [Blastococcus sp. SYSU D00813]